MPSGTTIRNAIAASLSEFQSASDQLRHGLLEGVRGAEVALHRGGDPAPVLLVPRPVGAELVVQLIDRLLVCKRPEDGSPDIAGEQLGEEEDEEAQQEERDDRKPEALEEEARDGDRPLGGAGGVYVPHRRLSAL